MFGNVDQQIMQLRALGYSQEEIAQRLGFSQSTISQRLENIHRIAQQQEDPNKVFWDMILGGIGIALFIKILKELGKDRR